MSGEVVLRAGVTLGLFLVFAALEARWPRKARRLPRVARWPSNLGLILLDQAAVRLLVPLVPAVAAARWEGGGLLGWLAWPPWVEAVVAVVVLDLVVWGQHVVFHRVPWLWRLHRVHHADPDLDVTSGLRFHPVEILLSVGIKLGAVAALGPSAAAVVAFEVILNGMALFNHANLAWPAGVERAARWLVVTPDVHRIHHSIREEERHRNFGFNLVIWDRMFGTFVGEPRGGQEGLVVGDVAELRPGDVALAAMLARPFVGEGVG